MNIPDIPAHTLRNLTDAELIKHLEYCGHPAIESLASRFSDYLGSIDDLETDLEGTKERADELEDEAEKLNKTISEKDYRIEFMTERLDAIKCFANDSIYADGVPHIELAPHYLATLRQVMKMTEDLPFNNEKAAA